MLLLRSTTAACAYENNHFILSEMIADERGVMTERQWSLYARHVVLASGMIDRPLLFPGNDRPGIMLSASMRRLIGEFAVAPARRIAVYTNNDSGYLTAKMALQAGIDVAAIIDTRPESSAPYAQSIRDAGSPCHFQSKVVSTSGYRRLRQLLLEDAVGQRHAIECSALGISGGFTPLIHLASQRGAKVSYSAEFGAFIASAVPDSWHVVGGAAGALDLTTALLRLLTLPKVAVAEGKRLENRPPEAVEAWAFGTMEPGASPDGASSSKTWVDLQNDVKVSDIELAVRENYISVEHLERYMTLGMGTDQGRTSNMNGVAHLARLTGRSIDQVGITTFRPPYIGLRMSSIAAQRQGDLYRPRRYLPADSVHRALGAVIEDYGWQRPDWYRPNGEKRETAVETEMRAVRQCVGIFDGSSLGKIEVVGPDAAAFLAKFYVSNMATVRPGSIRYSVMLREDGIIFDDGVVARVSNNHFLASPSSTQAEAVAARSSVGGKPSGQPCEFRLSQSRQVGHR